MTQGGSGPIQISSLVSKVEVDLGSSTSELSKHRADLQQAEAATKQEAQSAGQMAGAIQSTDAAVKELNNNLSIQKQRLQALQEYQTGAGGAGLIKQLDDSIKQTEQEIERLKAELGGIGSEAENTTRKASASFVSVTRTVDELRTHLESLQQAQRANQAQGIFKPGLQEEINQTAAALRTVEGSSNDFGTAIGRTTERLVIHAIAYKAVYDAIHTVKAAWDEGIQASIDYQTSLLKVNALTNSGAADTKVYGRALVEMSQNFPASAKDLGEALFFIESHGIHGAAAMDLLRQSALANEAGLGKTADIARVAAGAVEAYGEKNLTSARAVDILTAGVKEGSLAPESLANSLGKVLATAASLGVPFEEVIANISTLTRQSIPAAQATTELSSVMTALAHPGADAKKALGEVGLSAQDLTKSLREDGLLATLKLMEDATGGNIETMARILPNIRALRDALGTMGTQGESYVETLKRVNESMGGTKTAADIMSQGVENQKKTLDNNFNALIIGLNVLPAMSAAMKDVTERIRMQTEATDRNKESVLIADQIREQFGSRTGETTERILRDAKSLNMSYAELNNLLSQMKVNDEFMAQMDYLAGRANVFKDPFGPKVPEFKFPEYGPPAPEPQAPQYDFEASRRAAQQMAEMGSEARSLHAAAEKLAAAENTQGLPDDAKMREAKDKLLLTAAEVEAGWKKILSPEEAAQRGAELKVIVDQLASAGIGATQAQIAALDQLTAKYGEHDAAVKKDAADQANARAEASRHASDARAAREADPLAGIRDAMLKDREELMGTAGAVMGDISKAVELKGQQGARAAGQSFGEEARKWGEALEKAGAPGWKDSFDHLMALGEVAVTTGSPEILAAIHQLLTDGEREIRDSNIAKAMAQEVAKANMDMLTAQARADDQLAQAFNSAADSRANAMQQDVDRQYDIWAGRQVQMLTENDRNKRELQRIDEQWAREDTDRADQQARARADRDTAAERAAQDRARQAARSMADLQAGQSREQSNLSRSRQREEADGEYEHKKRITQITTAGGPDVAKNIATENANYLQSIADRTRKRQEDDADASIARQQAVADAQRKIAEQAADSTIKAQEQAQDLSKRQGEQDADLVKTRARQLQSRKDQQTDQEYLRNQQLLHEQELFVDAESKAQRQLQNDLARIEARYNHELEKNATTSEQIQLKRAHDEDAALIRAQAKYGEITEDQATTKLGELDTTYSGQINESNTSLRQREQAIDEALRKQTADSRRYAPGFTPTSPQGAPGLHTQPEWLHGGVSSAQDSIMSTWRAFGAQLPFLNRGQQGGAQEPIPVRITDIDNVPLQDLADASNDRPLQMDGESVEDVQSRIRRNRSRSRASG